MTKVVVTADVEDGKKWEEGFRTHADLFREYGVQGDVHFSVLASNQIALYLEVDDLDHYLKMMDSDATAKAMQFDGVIRESVKIYELDKTMEL
jgi:hypothetical protein